jgi:hypothetical protein
MSYSQANLTAMHDDVIDSLLALVPCMRYPRLFSLAASLPFGFHRAFTSYSIESKCLGQFGPTA